MLSIEIRVNGHPVGTVSAYRGDRQFTSPGDDIVFEYPYRASFFSIHHDDEPYISTGYVSHAYDEGMEVLAAKILADIAGLDVE